MSYTVNIVGGEYEKDLAEKSGYHSYHSNGVCAIETHDLTEEDAIKTVKDIYNQSVEILYAFE